MKSRMYWGVAILIILLIGMTGVFLLSNRTPDEPDVFYHVPSNTSNPAAAGSDKVPVEQNGDIDKLEAEDVNVHPFNTVTSDWTPALVKIPEGITAPDVKAAWERLDYISKNRHQWGNFSHRALELMAELTPVPSIYDTAEGDGCGDSIPSPIILDLDWLACCE